MPNGAAPKGGSKQAADASWLGDISVATAVLRAVALVTHCILEPCIYTLLRRIRPVTGSHTLAATSPSVVQGEGWLSSGAALPQADLPWHPPARLSHQVWSAEAVTRCMGCRYATLLEASMAHAPQVSSIKVPELLEFCADAGHRFRLEATGTLLIPPSFNVMVTDWERSIRLRSAWVMSC